MKRVAVIPARGGSRRIPKKNIKPFCKRPIIEYSIDAALKSGVFDAVMVSTDSDEIAEIAEECGASVPFIRSAANSGDYATANEVLYEVLKDYQKRGESFETGCLLYPTAPFVTADRLKAAVEKLEETDADVLIPVVRFSYPPQRAMLIRNDRLVFEYPEHLNSRSQDLEPHFHDAGQFVIFKSESFLKNRHLMLGNIVPMEISELEVQDLDTLTDWEIAEIKYTRLLEDKE